MKILFYNWVDDRDPEGRGGGVSVYQRAVLEALSKDPAVHAVFISAGLSFDVTGGAPRWEALRADGPTPRYEIINSGVQAPSHQSFGAPAQVSHPPTQAAFFDFLEQTGPYDVVHFNNLEGLPADVLRLKDRWPDTRIVFSLHNYYPVCPQVNLWYREQETCTDFAGGQRCTTCLLTQPNARAQRLNGALNYRLRRVGITPGGRIYDHGVKTAVQLAARGVRGLSALRRKAPAALNSDGPDAHAQTTDDGAQFADRRRRMIQLINSYCDRVLCVSDAVRQLAAQYGITPDLLTTDYIGTKAAQVWQTTQPRPQVRANDGTLSLGYLGYMRRDKGFFFLLDALEAMPDAMAARLRLVIAARHGSAETMARLEALDAKFAQLTYLDGYTHAQLDDILAKVDVGVVPVLWNDNLPQVAIEMHARHIPLITSDLGGAQELGGDDRFVFEAGNSDALQAIVARLLAGQMDMDPYWANAKPPVDMGTHIRALLRFYDDP